MLALFAAFVLIASFQTSEAVKCYVCSSADIATSGAKSGEIAYQPFSCPNGMNCTSGTKQFTIETFYKGDTACGTALSADQANKLKGANEVDCDLGCIKIVTNLVDRGSSLSSRVTRQCAYGDKEQTSRYFGQAGFKRTGTGSDKVNNWFYYCNGEYCNASPKTTAMWTLVISASLCQLGLLLS